MGSLTVFTFGETVTRLRGTPILDPYSGEVTGLDWSTPIELAIPDTGIEPRPTSEPVQDARNAVVSGFTLYAPFGVDVTPADRVRVRGTIYDVDGEVAEWRNPFTGWSAGSVVQTKRVAG